MNQLVLKLTYVNVLFWLINRQTCIHFIIGEDKKKQQIYYIWEAECSDLMVNQLSELLTSQVIVDVIYKESHEISE